MKWYSEMKAISPDYVVEYFVSYYDYHQPEAYTAKTDTFTEKFSLIDGKIHSMRRSATKLLLERRDMRLNVLTFVLNSEIPARSQAEYEQTHRSRHFVCGLVLLQN